MLISILIISSYCFSQAPSIEWKKCYGGFAGERPENIIQTSDGGYAFVGITDSNDGDTTHQYGLGDIWVVKLSANGSIEWQKSFGGTRDDHGHGIAQTTDGGYIVVGFTRSSDNDVVGSHGDSECWALKLSSAGTLEWQKPMGGLQGDFGLKVKQSPDGGYLIIGLTASNDGDVTTNHGSTDFWAIKLDSNGSIQWKNTYGGSAADAGYSVDVTQDGGFVLAGYTSSNNGDVTGNHGAQDGWVIKINPQGALSWQKTFGGSNNDQLYSIKSTSDGGYIAVGNTSSIDGDLASDDHQGYEWVVKMDANGILQWQKTYGGSVYENALSVTETALGGYIIAGTTLSTNGDVTGQYGEGDYWIVRLAANGSLQWQKTYGGTFADVGTDIKQTSDGGYIICGQVNSLNGDVVGIHTTDGIEGNDVWIVKLQPELSIAEFVKDPITVYPNPATEQLQFQLSGNSLIDKAIIVDASGKTVLISEGSNTSINVMGLSKGTYILQVFSEGNQFNTKFIKQ